MPGFRAPGMARLCLLIGKKAQALPSADIEYGSQFPTGGLLRAGCPGNGLPQMLRPSRLSRPT
jgi:hypothetical protein